jgi:hypothetical protein
MLKVVFFIAAMISLPWLKAESYVGPGAFRAHAHISVTQFQVTATVVNQAPRAVLCSGYVYGQTWSGITTWGYMNSVVVLPGQWAHVNAFTNTYDPFVNGWSDLWCRFY